MAWWDTLKTDLEALPNVTSVVVEKDEETRNVHCIVGGLQSSMTQIGKLILKHKPFTWGSTGAVKVRVYVNPVAWFDIYFDRP